MAPAIVEAPPVHRASADIDQPSKPGVFVTVDQLKGELLKRNPRDFVSRFLFDSIPFAFQDDIEKWISWRTNLALSLDVDPKEIILIGSSAIGFSLNPTKNFRPYDSRSDIDVGVINQHYFDIAWRYLRQLRPQWLALSRETQEAIKAHRKNHVFAGTIATDSMLSILPFGQKWQKALDAISREVPTNNREVKIRIYRDFDSLRYYHVNGIEKLLQALREEFDEEIIA